MNKDKYVFSLLSSFLDRSKFNRIVAKYNGDRYIKSFSCWNQLLEIMFVQLYNRDGLRDLIVALEAQPKTVGHNRQRRKWISRKYYASVMNTKEFFESNIGRSFTAQSQISWGN